MRRRKHAPDRLGLAVVLLVMSLLLPEAQRVAIAQATSPPPRDLTHVLDAWVTMQETLIVNAADAMPEDRFAFAPSTGGSSGGEFKGVRTFAEQVKHLAAANYQLAAGALGEDPPAGTHDETAPESVRTKAEVMQYLRGSFALLHRAAAVTTPATLTEGVSSKGGRTRLWLVIDALVHGSDHYGQMVEYLRMNGIVPPASR